MTNTNDLQTTKQWTKRDTGWTLNLFGTAVGAGILYLPISAGMGGLWPLVIMALLIGPMTWLSHRALTRFISSSAHADSDITVVVEEKFGRTAGEIITLGYFLAIYPILLIYGVAITNEVAEFLHFHYSLALPRPLLSLALILLMVGGVIVNEHLMLQFVKLLVYPLILSLLALSLYLIPQWRFEQVFIFPDIRTALITILFTLPVLVFAFNFSPACSAFVLSYRRHTNSIELSQYKTELILKRNATLLFFFIMLFVFSCVLSTTPEQMQAAKLNNQSALTFLAHSVDSGIIAYLGPIIALVAIISSFFGHFLGAREGLNGMINKQLRRHHPDLHISPKKINAFTILFITLTTWLVAIINPNILDIIAALVAPIIAIILYLLPVYAIHTIPALHKYKSWTNPFVFVMGVIVISGYVMSTFIL